MTSTLGFTGWIPLVCFTEEGNQVTERPGDSTRAILQVCKWALKKNIGFLASSPPCSLQLTNCVPKKKSSRCSFNFNVSSRSYKLRHWALKVQSLDSCRCAESNDNDNRGKSSARICGPNPDLLPLLVWKWHVPACSPFHLLESQKSCYWKSKQDRQHYYLPGACWKYRLSGSIMKLSNQNLHFNRTPRWSVCTWRHK